jgi:prepilin-type N-terminal cleavage/methylation domain-containing protein
MRDLSTRGAQDESGFTLIELLVVILIIGILAAIAIPSLLSQRSKAYDSSAKTVAQTAQTTMETFGTENDGEYTLGTAAKLKAIEPTLNTSNSGEAELLETCLTPPTAANGACVGVPTGLEYAVTVRAVSTKDEYTVWRKSGGEVVHDCISPKTGCPGTSSSSTSW